MFEVAYILISANRTLVNRRRKFKTENAMWKHIDKLDDDGKFYSVLGTRKID